MERQQNEMLIREKDVLRKRLGHVGTHQIIGAESGLKEVMALVRYVAPTATPVLITGETGVGKELVAHAIHQESNGIPRLINRICEKCLMYGAQQQKRLIDEHIVKFVAENELIGGAN